MRISKFRKCATARALAPKFAFLSFNRQIFTFYITYFAIARAGFSNTLIVGGVNELPQNPKGWLEP